jgi:hypothetical protein
MGRACRTDGEKKNVYISGEKKPEEKGPLGRQRHRWVDNIKADLEKRGW